MLNVIKLSVDMLNVVVPILVHHLTFFRIFFVTFQKIELIFTNLSKIVLAEVAVVPLSSSDLVEREGRMNSKTILCQDLIRPSLIFSNFFVAIHKWST